MSRHGPEAPSRFVLCVRRGVDDDLEVRKAYHVLPAAPNEAGFLRVVDESGEDYLYPSENFVLIDVPQNVEDILLHAA